MGFLAAKVQPAARACGGTARATYYNTANFRESGPCLSNPFQLAATGVAQITGKSRLDDFGPAQRVTRQSGRKVMPKPATGSSHLPDRVSVAGCANIMFPWLIPRFRLARSAQNRKIVHLHNVNQARCAPDASAAQRA